MDDVDRLYPRRSSYLEDKKMIPKTIREHIISLHGHVSGLKKDIASIKKNDLKHIHQDVEKLGGKIDKIYWVLLVAVGTVAMSLISTYLM